MKKVKRKIGIGNRIARHNYFIDDTIECGISLRGNEVKSICAGMCNLSNSWCSVENGNLIVHNMFVSRWDTANMFDVDENRDRQLLAHKKEIVKLQDATRQKGVTLIPLKIYANDNNKLKMLVGVCRGKHNYDKRNDMRLSDVNRDISRAMKEVNHG